MSVKELRGLKSVYAVNALYNLVFGLAAEQAHLGQDFETTFAKFEALDPKGQREQLAHAFKVVNLPVEDMLNLLSFALDANGVPYDEARAQKMKPDELMNAMLEVACKVAQTIKPRSISDNAKKNCL